MVRGERVWGQLSPVNWTVSAVILLTIRHTFNILTTIAIESMLGMFSFISVYTCNRCMDYIGSVPVPTKLRQIPISMSYYLISTNMLVLHGFLKCNFSPILWKLCICLWIVFRILLHISACIYTSKYRHRKSFWKRQVMNVYGILNWENWPSEISIGKIWSQIPID